MFAIARIFVARTLIIGTTPLSRELVETINSQPRSRYSIIGVVGELEAKEELVFPSPLVGALEDLERIVVEQRPSRIVIALGERRRRLPVQQLVQARIRRRILVEDGGDLYERLTGKLAIDSLTPSNVIFSQDFKPSGTALVLARVISVLAAFFGLMILAPLFGLIAYAIKRDSPGPVLFVQDRVGLGSSCFRMLKFRTMHMSAETRSEWAGDNGDRITRVGRWLRRFRLGELPQFINILRGDMNLVGPRPHPFSNYGLFTVVSRNLPECGEQIPYSSLRAMVRPGITGWAQVRFRYANDLDEEMEKLRYDLFYIKHYSVRLDIRIILETVRIVLLGAGSGEKKFQKKSAHPHEVFRARS
jgi:exopolysaccharide biosynthesis polyprenyl glycosylphosphotransferase